MKIGIISDTHGSVDDFAQALEILKEADKILHLGDVLYHGPRNPLPESYDPKTIAEGLEKTDKIIYIKGNCDSEVDEMIIKKDLSQPERFIDVDGYRFYLTHGHRKTQEEMLEIAKTHKANLVITGHTHVKKLEWVDGVLFLNPGSTSLPKDGSKSIAYYEEGQVVLVDLESGEEIKRESLEIAE